MSTRCAAPSDAEWGWIIMTAELTSNQLDVVAMLKEKTAEIRKRMTLEYQIGF